jgi:hypothetical protein
MDISCQSRSPTASVRFIGVLAAVIMIAAGCGSSAGHGHPAVTAGTTSAVTPDPCTALPAADVARIAHLAAAATVTLRGRGLCEYGAAESGNGVIIGVGPYSRAQFDAGLRSARSRGARCIDLRIGEAAYGCGPSSSYEVVNVYADGLAFSVQVTRAGPDQPAETRALAQFAVSRY